MSDEEVRSHFSISISVWGALQYIREIIHTSFQDGELFFADYNEHLIVVTQRRKYDELGRIQVRRFVKEFSNSGSRKPRKCH